MADLLRTERRTRRTLLAAVLSAAALVLAVARPGAGQDAPSVVMMVIDTSGSVGAKDLTRVRRLALEVLRALPAGSEVGVIAFDDKARVVVRPTRRSEVVTRGLESLRTQGRFTALHDALYDASRQLGEAGVGRRAIVLVSDGKDENSDLDLEDGLRLAQQTRIPVFTVGVGRVQERMMRRIARLTGGEYVDLARASGPALASRIAKVEARRRPAGSEDATRRDRPAAEKGAAAGRADGAGAGAPEAPLAKGSDARWPRWLALLAIPVLAAAVVWWSRRHRDSEAVRCPSCGRELPNPLSRCPVCGPVERVGPATAARPEVAVADPSAASPGAATAAPPDVVVDEMLSPTVLERMNVTEEFLEKTITLREKPVLTITRGPGAGQVFDLSDQTSTSIGRAKANDIVINDVAVSSQQCRIRPQEGRFVLHDLKSTNGTFVNERRVTSPHVLAEGDVVKVGETQLLFKTDLKRM